MPNPQAPRFVHLPDGRRRIFSSQQAAQDFVINAGIYTGCRIEEVPAPRSSLGGHHSDGSGVQRHSVGGIYPLVLVARESGLSQDGLVWGVQGPGDANPFQWFPTTSKQRGIECAMADADEILARRAA